MGFKFNPFTVTLDRVTTDHGALGGLTDNDHNQYLLTDCTNDPLTGNLEISKADPQLLFTDTGDSNSASIFRSDTSGKISFNNAVNVPSGLGNAIDLDGSDDKITVLSDNSLNLNNHTISAWVYQHARASVFDVIVNKYFSINRNYILYISSTGTITGGFEGGFSTSSTTFSTNTWTHLAVRYDGTSVDLFINGVETAYSSHYTGGGTPPAGAGSLYIGETIGGYNYWYDGLIDELVIWGTALSDNDINDLYNGGSGLRVSTTGTFPTDGGSMGTNLAALYHFDETALGQAPGGKDVEDSSTNSNHGTTQGSMTDGDFVMGLVPGAVGVDETHVYLTFEDGVENNEQGVLTLGSVNGAVKIQSDTITGYIGGVYAFGIDGDGIFTINNSGSAVQQLILKAAAAATENIQEWQDSSSNILAYVDENGDSQFGNLVIGTAETGVDYTLTFDGETNDGLLTWMEDEDYFQFSDDMLSLTSEKHYFRDTAIGVYSQTDSYLDVFADGGIRIGDSSAGAPTNYANFAPDGELTLVGTARVEKEVQLIANDFSPGASGATELNIGNYSGWQFTIGDDIITQFEIPHDWDSSTNLEFVMYWYINEAYATNSGEVQWQAAWSATPANSTEAIDAPTHTGTIDFGDQNIPATAKYLTMSSTGTIASASLSEGDLIGLTISRVALDDGSNPTAEPVIAHIEFHYTSNKLGEAT